MASTTDISTGEIGATSQDTTTIATPELTQATTHPSSTTPSTGEVTNTVVGVQATNWKLQSTG